MPFRYRLQKILDFRIKKKEEQLQAVVRAQEKVHRIEGQIQENNRNIENQRQHMRKADPQMYEAYDNYLKSLYDRGDVLKSQLEYAVQELEEEKAKLMELEKAVKVLEKHKEKLHDEYKNEEKKVELRRLSEVAVQRHFAKTRDEAEEQQISEDELKLLEGSEFNEY